MKNNYYLTLNIKATDIIKKDWVNPLIGAEGNFIKGFGSDYANEVFTDDFLDKFKAIAIIHGVLLFHKDKFEPSWGAHVDCIKYDDDGNIIRALAALNVVFDEGSDIGTMQWFKLKDNVPERVKLTNINSLFLEWPPEELNLVEECTILEYPALVRTDVPHTVRTGDSKRTCVSLRFESTCNTWEELHDLFNKTFNQ